MPEGKPAACIISQPDSVVTFNKRPSALNIQLSNDYIQDINYSQDPHQGREKVKKIIREWYSADHRDYDLLTNNSQNFCNRCITIAEQNDKGAMNEDGLESANCIIGYTVFADHVYSLPLLPLSVGRNICGAVGRRWARK